MYASKTTTLLEITRGEEQQGRRVLRVKHKLDQRYDASPEEATLEIGFLRTHDGAKQEARQVAKLAQLGGSWKLYDTIAIDEGCFFPDLLHFAEEVDAAGKSLIVAGLDYTYALEPFGEVLALAERAKRVIQLRARCRCGRPAVYTERTRYVGTEAVLVPGGAELYRPACETCHVVPGE